jgi:hypothetical protein
MHKGTVSRMRERCAQTVLTFRITFVACKTAEIACLHLWLTSANLNRSLFRWQCPVSSPVCILDWFWPNSYLARLAEILLSKSLACLCPRMDCQYSSCCLLVQPLISPMVTYVDVGMAGSGTVMDMRNVAWLIWDSWYCFAKIHLRTANHMARKEW